MTAYDGVLCFQSARLGVWSANWAWGLPLIVLTVVIHVLSLGLANVRAERFFGRAAGHRSPMVTFVVVISAVTLWATVMHGVEAGLWALFYQFLGARPDYKSAMLYSLGALTTYGHSGLYLEEGWQLMGAIEALSGWLLFGLTTAFLFALIQRCRGIADRDHLLQPQSGRQV
jgi:hypothetical protein